MLLQPRMTVLYVPTRFSSSVCTQRVVFLPSVSLPSQAKDLQEDPF
jgi:hypothetical protein